MGIASGGGRVLSDRWDLGRGEVQLLPIAYRVQALGQSDQAGVDWIELV